MSTVVYLDNMIWNFLFDRGMDLVVELPSPDFAITITREAEFEIPPIPETKAELKAFIASTLQRCTIETDVYFGFYDDSLPPEEQRVGGFDEGRWIQPEETAFIESQRHAMKATLRPSRLYGNEADISIAARSFHSVVITLDDKKGPLRDAKAQGGRVVFLTDFDKSGLTLREFIERA